LNRQSMMRETWSTHLCPWLADAFDTLIRIYRHGNLGHALLLAGPRGAGKSNLAHALATQIVSAKVHEPGVLTAASAIDARDAATDTETSYPDVHVLAPTGDKRTISVEQVRDAIADLALTSLGGFAKVLIVEPAEAMTAAAANALLKTLEEPTAATYFLLVSHQPGFLPATVRSRCQLYMAPTPSAESALAWLEADSRPDVRPELEGLLAVCGGQPLRAADLVSRNKININNELEDLINSILDDSAESQKALDGWLKDDADTLLGWLVTRLEWAIKARLAPDAWTPVTDLDGDRLHNAWRHLTLESLFECHSEAAALRRQIGSGTNLGLGLRVVLQGMAPGVAGSE
jgi:DNA polymerase-3 subunit delta'